MAVSTRPQDKFAFLFSGSDDDQYIADLRKVLDTLLNWFGYPADQIYVRVPFNVDLLTDPVFSTVNLDIDNITGADSTSLKASLQSSMEEFINMAKGLLPDIPSGEINTTFFYFTGEGRVNPVSSRYELHIGTADDATETYIDGNWLRARIINYNTSLRDNSYIHILMQQSFGYGFWQDVFSLITGTPLKMSFTAACNSNAENPLNSAGSDFTDYWTKALQLKQRDRTGTGDFIYADQEDTGGAEPDDNLLISLKKTFLFADSYTHSATEPKYEVILPAGEPADQYLGLPSFWIRDGDEPIPPETSDYWWESKDIFLTHPDAADPDARDDIYHASNDPDTGIINKVHVIIRNNGTHPVREFYSGTIIFLSGGGGVGDSVVHVVDRKIKPGEYYEHVYEYDFKGSEPHRCIRSRASLEEIMPEQLDMNGTDDVAWAVANRSNEAQRNLDKIIIAGKSATGAGETIPDAGQGMADETDPEGEAEPPVDENGNNNQEEGTTESKSASNLRNFAERRYVIRNVFKKPKRFVIPDPFDDPLPGRYVKLKLYGKSGNRKLSLLKQAEKPFRHFSFDIRPGVSQDIFVYVSLLNRKKIPGPIKIPFEIYLDTSGMKDAVVKYLGGGVKKTEIPDYLPFSGFSIEIVKAKGTTLYGTVFDSRKKPVKGALIHIMSGDKRQSAFMKTNRYGSYCVKNINPDNYIISVRSKENYPVKSVYAGDGLSVRVDFMVKPAVKTDLKKKINKKLK